VAARLQAARAQDDADYGVLYAGQTAGLLDAIEPAGALVECIARDAEALLRERAARLVS
jgi:hypothetical protein